MGQGLSCGASDEHGLFRAVQLGGLETVEALVERDSAILRHTTMYYRHPAVHIAAANGQIEILSLLLERSVNPNALNRHKQDEANESNAEVSKCKNVRLVYY